MSVLGWGGTEVRADNFQELVLFFYLVGPGDQTK